MNRTVRSCYLVATAILILTSVVAQERPLPGRQPGTERWLVWLRDRNYDLRAHLQTIRAAPTRQQREQLLANLDQLVLADQRDVTVLIQSNGGTVERHYWVLSALAVELPAAAVP